MLYTTIHIQCFGQFKALKSAYLSLLVLWKLGAACRIKSSTPAQVLFNDQVMPKQETIASCPT